MTIKKKKQKQQKGNEEKIIYPFEEDNYQTLVEPYPYDYE